MTIIQHLENVNFIVFFPTDFLKNYYSQQRNLLYKDFLKDE